MGGHPTHPGWAPPFPASMLAACPRDGPPLTTCGSTPQQQPAGPGSRRRCCSSRQQDAEVHHGSSCTGGSEKGQRGDVVYRVRLHGQLIRKERTCRAQRGRRCERGAAGRGGFSLIGAPFELREKICHSNSALAVTMREAFVASAEAFVENWGAKVTQMAGVTLEPQKTRPMTTTDPTRCPGSPQARPGAAHRVRNTHTEQAVSWRGQLVT